MQSGSGLGNLLILALPLLLFVFLFVSQRKRTKQVQELQSALAVGDEVVTTAGIYGTVTALDASVVTLEVSPGVHLRIDRRAIGSRGPEQPGTARPEGSGGPGTTPGEEG